jgi:regulatory protein YycH of two-component signal transduction system YycFG
MKTYSLTLKVQISCPEDTQTPENTIQPETLLESLRESNYAISDRKNYRARTASMKVLEVKFDSCPCCGKPK